MVKEVRLAHAYTEKQWKSSTLEWKNVFCMNGPYNSILKFSIVSIKKFNIE